MKSGSSRGKNKRGTSLEEIKEEGNLHALDDNSSNRSHSSNEGERKPK